MHHLFPSWSADLCHCDDGFTNEVAEEVDESRLGSGEGCEGIVGVSPININQWYNLIF